MSKEEEVRLSDQEMARVRAYALEQGLTDDEAATQLAKDAIAAKFKRKLNRLPAKVYDFNRSNNK
jgi:hypothetical protein